MTYKIGTLCLFRYSTGPQFSKESIGIILSDKNEYNEIEVYFPFERGYDRGYYRLANLFPIEDWQDA